MPQSLPIVDQRGRGLRDLRISVTDRCNFRCRYCMPRERFGREFRFLPRAEILTFEEIARTARIFAGLGVGKLRITGGEPLLRADLWKLVAQLRAIGDLDIALTTNGALLEQQAETLRDAGLGRVTVSLDSLDPSVFEQMTDSGVSVSQVLAGIDAAVRAGLQVKINTVVQRGVNDHTITQLAEHFRGAGHTLRFIEFMDVGATNSWDKSAVVSGQEIVERISTRFPLEPAPARYSSDVARRWRYRDGKGEIGVIASVSEPFCGACTRARLSAEGQLYTCLFASHGTDLRALLRDGSDDEHVTSRIRDVWSRRNDNYSEQRATLRPLTKKIEMSYIGG